MKVVAAILLFAVACNGIPTPEKVQYSVELAEQTQDHVQGLFKKDGEPSIQFSMEKDSNGHRSLHLARSGGDNLLTAIWTRSGDGFTVSHMSVMNHAFNPNIHATQSSEEKEQEQEAFNSFRATDEYKQLPMMSKILGEEKEVTGHGHPAALAFHRLALNSDRQQRKQRKESYDESDRHRVKRCDLGLNPWSDCSSDTFACNSPSGRCANGLQDGSGCADRGTPISPSQYSSGCVGMCGPGCYNCWTYICGDCCSHPGCLQHDGECSSYTSFDCLTAKGVLWGGGDSGYSDNC